MDAYLENIKKAYDKGILQEHLRLQNGDGKRELDLIIKTFLRYSNEANIILDIGCGTGTYTQQLSTKGYKVGCVDISPKSIAFLMAQHYNENIMFGEVGCVSELDKLDLIKSDAILLLGPMYHLVETSARRKALQNCWVHLNDNGLIYIMFLHSLKIGQESEKMMHGINRMEIADNGWISWVTYQGEEVPQFRCSILQAENEIGEFFTPLYIIHIPDEKSVEQFCIIARKKPIL